MEACLQRLFYRRVVPWIVRLTDGLCGCNSVIADFDITAELIFSPH